jgi:hypothetical protein
MDTKRATTRDPGRRSLGKASHEIRHPCRVFVVGKAQTGKTTLVVDLVLKRFPDMTRYIVVCPSFRQQSTYDPIRKLFVARDIHEKPSNQLFQKIYDSVTGFYKDMVSKGNHPPKTLIIFDDIAGQNMVQGNGRGAFANFSIQCTHWNASMIVISQQPKRIDVSFRENAEHIIAFPSESENEVRWLIDTHNSSIFSKTFNFKDVIFTAWTNGNGIEQVGKHFLYICAPPRSLARFFCDFDKEIVR